MDEEENHGDEQIFPCKVGRPYLYLYSTLSLPLTAEDSYASNTYTVSVQEGYLALRTAKAYDSRNEIGELYTGGHRGGYRQQRPDLLYVYSPKYGTSGYVNKNYLVGTSNTWTVSVSKGYLALRTAKAYDSRNEIGELYTGDTVQVTDSSDPTYWYVYSPKHGKSGYVNKNYLVSSSSSGQTRTVSVSKGYLALRTAKAYDSRERDRGALYGRYRTAYRYQRRYLLVCILSKVQQKRLCK